MQIFFLIQVLKFEYYYSNEKLFQYFSYYTMHDILPTLL